MSTREQLVADWRDRLSAAEADEAAACSQRRWLSRIRMRLYRILLSLYGSGDWRSDAAVGPAGPAGLGLAADSSAAEQSHRADETYCGKPAKSAGKIGAVLKALANAQDAPHEIGPLATGLPKDSWIVIASTSSSINPLLCAALLRKRGIGTRLVPRGEEIYVEVSLANEPHAAEVLEEAGISIHQRRFRQAPRRCGAAWYLSLSVLFGPLLGVVVVLFAAQTDLASGVGWLLLSFFGGWAASVLLGALCYVLDPGLFVLQWLWTLRQVEDAAVVKRR